MAVPPMLRSMPASWRSLTVVRKDVAEKVVPAGGVHGPYPPTAMAP
jgi:hypothetical protein